MNSKNANPSDIQKQIFDLLLKKAPNNFDTTDQDEIEFMLRFMTLIRSYVDEFERFITDQFFQGTLILNHFDQTAIEYKNDSEVSPEYEDFIGSLKKGVPAIKLDNPKLLVAESILDSLLAHQKLDE